MWGKRVKYGIPLFSILKVSSNGRQGQSHVTVFQRDLNSHSSDFEPDMLPLHPFLKYFHTKWMQTLWLVAVSVSYIHWKLDKSWWDLLLPQVKEHYSDVPVYVMANGVQEDPARFKDSLRVYYLYNYINEALKGDTPKGCCTCCCHCVFALADLFFRCDWGIHFPSRAPAEINHYPNI